MVNLQKLSIELRKKGISKDGNCNSSGVVWDDNNEEIQNRPDVVAIVSALESGVVDSISVDSNTIIGDGSDEILLSVLGKANTLITIDVLTGVTPSTINIQLDETGNGAQAFSCETSPTVILFSHGDISVKVMAL